MPPRLAPKIYQLLLRTHQLTIFLTIPSTSTIIDVKNEALSALLSEVGDAPGVPKVASVSEFELGREVKGKAGSKSKSKEIIGEYEVLEPDEMVLRDAGIGNWEVLGLMFRDERGELIPPTLIHPPIDEDEAIAIPPDDDAQTHTHELGDLDIDVDVDDADSEPGAQVGAKTRQSAVALGKRKAPS